MADLLSTIKGFFRKKKDEEQTPQLTPTIPITNLGVGTNTPSLEGVPKDTVIQPTINKVKDYFNPNTDKGNGFWSSPFSKVLSGVQSLIVPQDSGRENFFKSFGQGFNDWTTMGLVESPIKQNQNNGTGKAGYVAGAIGAVVNPLNPLNKIKLLTGAGPATENLVSKAIPEVAPRIVKKGVPLIAHGAGDVAQYTALNLAANKAGLNKNQDILDPKNLATSVILSTATRGVLGKNKPNVNSMYGGEAYVSDFQKVNEARQRLKTLWGNNIQLDNNDLDFINKATKDAEMYRKSYNLMDQKEWKKMNLAEQYDMISTKLEDAVRSGQPPIMGIVGNQDKIIKPTLKTTDDVVSAIQKDFKINPTKWSSNEPPVKLNEQEIISSLKNNYDVADSVIKDVLKNKKVTQGTGYVVQNNNGQVTFNVFDDFKNSLTTPVKEKSGVSLGVVGKQKAGMELSKPKVKVNYVDPSEYVKGTDTIRGGIRKIEKMPTVEVDPARVETIKSSIMAGDKINPIVLDKEGNIIEGAEQLKALKDLGVKNVQVVIKKSALTENGATQSKQVFNDMDREAQRLMDQEYGLKTPKQFDAATERQNKEVFNLGQQLDRSADKSMVSDTIDLAGKGDIQVPPQVLEAINRMKDKSGILAMPRYNRETAIRNIEDVVATPEDAQLLKNFFFGRVSEDTQNINNFVSSTRNAIKENIVDNLGIKPGSDLDKLVMEYGEGKLSLDDLKKTTNDWEKVVKADGYFRQLYDDLLTKINETITKYGYEPVPKRSNYYTHFQEMGNVFATLGDINRFEQLPTMLAGLTADFKPGKQFFKFAQPRLSDNFEYTPSALKSVDTYLEPAANQMFRTETIQRGRALERVINEAVQKNPELPNNYLNNFMSWYRDYLNTLAGKKSLGTRGMEQDLGRWMYTAAQTAKKQASANLVGGSVTSALTNFIPLTQSVASTDKKAFLQGLIKAAIDPLTDENSFVVDGIQSRFLRNRFGPDKLAPNVYEKVADKMSIPFQMVDKFVSNAVVTGKYIEQKALGKTAEEAMNIADDYAARVMADRSFGQVPQVFADKGWKSFFLQFQIEINNQVSHLTKDIPNMAEGDKLKVAKMLGEVAMASWLYNNVYEAAFGRRPAFDPVEAVSYTIQETYSNDNPNQKFQKIAKKWGDNLPFTQLLTNGGRIPVLAGLPDLNELTTDPKKALIKPLLVYLPPSGGYQLYKTMNGLQDFSKGYAETNDGRVKYLIEQDVPNFVRATLAGQYSFPEAQEYFDKARTPMGIDDTILMKVMLEKNPDKAQQIEEMLNKKREIDGELSSITQARSNLKLILGDPKSTKAQKDKAIKEYKRHAEKVVEDVKMKLKKGSKSKEESSIIDKFFHLFVKTAYAADETMGPTKTNTQTNPATAPQTNVNTSSGNQTSADPLSMIGGLNIDGVTKKKVISVPTIRSVAKPKAISLSSSLIKPKKIKEMKVKSIDTTTLKDIASGKKLRRGIQF